MPMVKLVVTYKVDKVEYSTDTYVMEVEPNVEILREIAKKADCDVEDLTEDDIKDWYERTYPWDFNLDCPDDTDYHDSDTSDIDREVEKADEFIAACLELEAQDRRIEHDGQLAMIFAEME